MKKFITIGLSSIWIAAMIFIACTKDQLPVPQNNPAEKSFLNPGTNAPVYNYGTMKGTLSPAPAVAKLWIHNEKGFSLSVIADVNGSFKVNNIPGDTYDIQVAYTIQRGEFVNTLFHEMARITVKDGEVTDLGIIYLPWVY